MIHVEVNELHTAHWIGCCGANFQVRVRNPILSLNVGCFLRKSLLDYATINLTIVEVKQISYSLTFLLTQTEESVEIYPCLTVII